MRVSSNLTIIRPHDEKSQRPSPRCRELPHLAARAVGNDRSSRQRRWKYDRDRDGEAAEASELSGQRASQREAGAPGGESDLAAFESSEEFQAAQAEAEAQAEAIVQTYTVTRIVSRRRSGTNRCRRICRGWRRSSRATHAEDARRAEGDRLRYDRDAGLRASQTERAGDEVPEVRLRGRSRVRRCVAGASDVDGGRRSVRHERGGGDRRGQVVPPPADLPAPGHLRRLRLDAQPLDAANLVARWISSSSRGEHMTRWSSRTSAWA